MGKKNNCNFRINNINQQEAYSLFDVDVTLPNKKKI